MSINLLPHEVEGYNKVKNIASECTLFFKRDYSFPIDKPSSLLLVGSGARHTIKGGTGSGDVNSRYFLNIEEAFINEGFNITSKEWLDSYDQYKKRQIPFIYKTR